jgi:hypothetical protein
LLTFILQTSTNTYIITALDVNIFDYDFVIIHMYVVSTLTEFLGHPMPNDTIQTVMPDAD